MNYKRAFLIIVIFLLGATSPLFSQKENNVWYFGLYSGLDFNSNPPTPLYQSKFYAPEGCASVSDSLGKLLFYTEGKKVYQKDHQQMNLNGDLKGHYSSTQGAVIVRKPASSNIYYIINGDCYEDTSDGIFYSVVDMNRNFGLGEIIELNTPLLKMNASEKVTAVKDATGCGFWIITHSFTDNSFYSYHLTSLGLDTNAVISKVGFDYGKASAASLGYLKASPDHKKLAAALYYYRLELFDFDNSSGVISNGIIVDSNKYFYGASFSPNSKLLYSSTLYGPVLYQYDISLSSVAAIQASSHTIAFGSNTGCVYFGALQIAPDGKIYLSKPCALAGSYYLGVINKPDVQGYGCNYKDTGILISGGNAIPYLGLPEIVESPVPNGITLSIGKDTIVCNKPSYIIKQVQQTNGKWLWSNNDTTPSITVSTPGKYWLQSNSNCGIQRDTITIDFVTDTAKVNFGKDTLACGTEYELQAPIIPYSKYLWSTGDTTIKIKAKTNSLYWLTVNAACGFRADTIIVRFFRDSLAPIYIGKDTVLCADSFSIKVDSVPNTKYLWSTGETTRTINPKNSGNYWLQVSNYCFKVYDTLGLSLIKDTVPAINLGADSLACPGNVVLQTDSVPHAIYKWSTGDTARFIAINKPGNYWVKTKTLCNAETDTISISYYSDTTALFIGKDTTVCGNQLQLTANTIPMAHYTWWAGDTITSITIDTNGMYWAQATTPCAVKYDSVNVTFIKGPLPQVNLGNDTILCDNSLALEDLIPRTAMKYLWSNGDTLPAIAAKKTGTYWLEINNTCETDRDTVQVEFIKDSITSIFIGNDTLLCYGSLKLDAGWVPKATYSWSTGETTQSITINKAGTYIGEASTYICNTPLRDTITITYYKSTAITLPSDTFLCSGAINLDAGLVPNAHYTWNTGDTTQTINVNQPGVYSVEVYAPRCNDLQKDSVAVGHYVSQAFKLPPDVANCKESFSGILLNPGISYNSYLWNTGSTSPTLFATEDGLYTLTVNDSCGNTFSDDILIDLCDCRLHVPTAFTPNGDGKNDSFIVHSYCGLVKYNVKIFSRWGQLVFETADPTKSWDGTHNGVPAPEGTYTISIQYEIPKTRNSPDYSGTVTLLR